MKIRYFMLGYSFSSFMIMGYFGYHAWKTYVKVKPAIVNYQQGNPFSEKQKKDMSETLIKLAGFGEIVSHPELSTQTYSAAAAILSSSKDGDDIIKTKYYFIRALETGLEYAHKTGNYEKLLEAKTGYAIFLMNKGQATQGSYQLEEALDIGKRMAPKSPVIQRIERVLKKNRVH